jgi:hypothetical protein
VALVRLLQMTTFLKCAFGCALVALLAGSRFLYVHFFHVHNKEALIGEALDPINQIAMLAFFLFGAATVIFLLLAAFRHLVDCYDRKEDGGNAF